MPELSISVRETYKMLNREEEGMDRVLIGRHLEQHQNIGHKEGGREYVH